MPINESAEDYLETILLLTKKTGMVRSKDIVDEMGFSKPSVSVAMKKLRKDGMIIMDPEGFIKLTENGEQAAANVYERHSTISGWLVSIGVSVKNAEADACRMEHVLSEESFESIKRMISEGHNR